MFTVYHKQQYNWFLETNDGPQGLEAFWAQGRIWVADLNSFSDFIAQVESMGSSINKNSKSWIIIYFAPQLPAAQLVADDVSGKPFLHRM